jgi:predicted nuclease with TOPRIM domain
VNEHERAAAANERYGGTRGYDTWEENDLLARQSAALAEYELCSLELRRLERERRRLERGERRLRDFVDTLCDEQQIRDLLPVTYDCPEEERFGVEVEL